MNWSSPRITDGVGVAEIVQSDHRHARSALQAVDGLRQGVRMDRSPVGTRGHCCVHRRWFVIQGSVSMPSYMPRSQL
jgi:hypothetical protein